MNDKHLTDNELAARRKHAAADEKKKTYERAYWLSLNIYESLHAAEAELAEMEDYGWINETDDDLYDLAQELKVAASTAHRLHAAYTQAREDNR